MGRSDHRSKKRKRSSSRSCLANIENTLERLISMLADREVRRPQVRFLSPSSSSAGHRDRASDLERDIYAPEDVPSREIFVPDKNIVAMPASREGPRDARDPGVFEIPRSVYPDSGIGTIFSDSRNNLSSFADLITNHLSDPLTSLPGPQRLSRL